MAAGEVKGRCCERPPSRASRGIRSLGSRVHVQAARWVPPVPSLVSSVDLCCPELPSPHAQENALLVGSQVPFLLKICRPDSRRLCPLYSGSCSLYYFDSSRAQEPNLVFGVRPPWAHAALHRGDPSLPHLVNAG